MPPNRHDAKLERLRLAWQVDSVEAVPKAQEFLRIMGLKCRPGALGKGEPCRTEIALDLACRALGCPVPHKTAVQLCGIPEAIYLAALGTAQRLLGVQRRYSCKEIAQSVGGARVGTMATSELKRYKERFLASYPTRQAASIDLDNTVYAVAAFYLCARKIKHPVNKQRLLELSLVREAELTGVCRSMLELCYSTLGVSISDKPSKERLEMLAKTAALTGGNTAGQKPPSGSGNTTTATTAAAAAEAPSGNKSGRFGTASGGNGSGSSFGNKRRGGGGAGAAAGSASRRPIPLTRLVGPGGEPMNHVSALAWSIQAAAGKKRAGGATVAAVEPGGNNDRNNSINDRTYRPAQTKRPRPNASTSTSASTTAAAAAAGPGRGSRGSSITAASTAASTAAATAASTATATAASTAAATSPALAPPPVSRVPRAPMVNPYGARAATTAATIRRPVGGHGSNGGADGAVAVASTGAAAVAASTATANRASTPAAPPTSVSRVPRAPIVNPYAVRATTATTIAAAIDRQVGRGGSNCGGASELVVTSVQEVLATAPAAARTATAARTPNPAALPPSSVSKVPRAPLPPPVGRDGADHGRRPLLLHDAAAEGGAVSARGDDGLPPPTVSPVNPVGSREGGGSEHLTVDSGDGKNYGSSSAPSGRLGEGFVHSRLGMDGDRPDSGGKGTRGGPISGGGGGRGGGGCGGSGGGGGDDDGGIAGSPKGHSLGGGGRGGEEGGRSGRGHEHAEWRNRVLASMENRMKVSASAGSSAAAAGGGGARPFSATAAGLSGPATTGAADVSATTINTSKNVDADANANARANAIADANGDGSSRRGDSLAAAPTAGKSTKQASLEAFFPPSARGEENTNRQ